MRVRSGHSRVRLRDVAEAAGVSVSAVSQALNGNGTISQATAERVRTIATEMCYRPDLLAASLRRQRTSTLGILTSFLNHPFHGELLAVLTTEAASRGFSLLVATASDESTAQRQLEQLVDQRCAGVIVFGDRPLTGSVGTGVPMVMLYAENWAPGLGFSAVEIDDRGGIRRAVEHLLSRGHRRIALIANRSRPRHAGYEGALRAAGIEPDPSLVLDLPVDAIEWTAAEHLTVELLHRSTDVSAVVATSDAAAFGVIRGAHLAGRTVPADLAVVGFDDTSLASTFVPSLTTVRQPTGAIVREALALHDELMRGQEPRSVRLETELIVRESSGMPWPAASRRG
jgi:LacI family transcriptional regulator